MFGPDPWQWSYTIPALIVGGLFLWWLGRRTQR